MKAKPTLGVDPGLANCGWALVSYELGRFKWVDGGTIETKAKTPYFTRLCSVAYKLHGPYSEAGRVSYEMPNGFRSKRTIQLTYGCIGILHGLAVGHQLNISSVSVKDVKMLAGYYQATKGDIKIAVMENIVDIPDGLSDHVYDAAAVAIVSTKGWRRK